MHTNEIPKYKVQSTKHKVLNAVQVPAPPRVLSNIKGTPADNRVLKTSGGDHGQSVTSQIAFYSYCRHSCCAGLHGALRFRNHCGRANGRRSWFTDRNRLFRKSPITLSF